MRPCGSSWTEPGGGSSRSEGMAAKLKVFRYSDGFHAWTVAASSRPKALAAWGVKRDLFKDGSA